MRQPFGVVFYTVEVFLKQVVKILQLVGVSCLFALPAPPREQKPSHPPTQMVTTSQVGMTAPALLPHMLPRLWIYQAKYLSG